MQESNTEHQRNSQKVASHQGLTFWVIGDSKMHYRLCFSGALCSIACRYLGELARISCQTLPFGYR